jgi:5'-3' exonuclease
MGIPSYFSYIVKNHIEILQKYVKSELKVHNLYLDCNSIIYDVVRNINFAELTETAHKSIIQNVIAKLEEYIETIEPSENVFIAFDGVAPVAKLEQQRTRRYKSWYQAEVSKTIFKTEGTDLWNTTAITPGTEFMRDLSVGISDHFLFNAENFLSNPNGRTCKKIMVSTSETCGEGEHKLFDYIRKNPEEHKDQVTVIYGLDADLIMLSINHLPISPNIYLYRETPEFIKSIDNSLEPNESYLLDIPYLAEIIIKDMNNGKVLTTEQAKNRVYDYIFLCFFLGNDFLPHFPAVNIRTGGIDKLLGAYKATIGKTDENLTDGKVIYWKNVRRLVEELASSEEEWFNAEMNLRGRREKYNYPEGTPEQRYTKFEAIPNYDRDMEKYIDPSKKYWQYRYYKALFQIDIKEDECKKIATNYMEGLEWTMKYYTEGCADWRWHYKYNYPPLLSDLLKYIPHFGSEFVPKNSLVAVSPLVQLCYVLPRHSLHFLPEKLYKALIAEHEDWYKTDCEFVWAFCRYFWECHIVLPDIDVKELEDFVLASSTGSQD